MSDCPHPLPKMTAIDYAGTTQAEPPVPGAKAVYWIMQGHYGLQWEHKGWLMPTVR